MKLIGGPFKPYLGEEAKLDSRMTQMQEYEDDEDISTINTSTPTQVQIHGPIARACASHHNYLVSSFLNSCPSHLDNGDTCTLVLLRNGGDDQKDRDLAQAGFGLQN
jgi:hypothetical protein